PVALGVAGPGVARRPRALRVAPLLEVAARSALGVAPPRARRGAGLARLRGLRRRRRVALCRGVRGGRCRSAGRRGCCLRVVRGRLGFGGGCRCCGPYGAVPGRVLLAGVLCWCRCDWWLVRLTGCWLVGLTGC